MGALFGQRPQIHTIFIQSMQTGILDLKGLHGGEKTCGLGRGGRKVTLKNCKRMDALLTQQFGHCVKIPYTGWDLPCRPPQLLWVF